ncbi:MAG: hypothetical protein NWE91_00620 [Candidatus Bathyarchaeota archaeon]|nr:hypothetical protein [Candidatus Bathyarchaeota archaeon]
MLGVERKDEEDKGVIEKGRNLRWVIVISLFMFYSSFLLFPYYYYQEDEFKRILRALTIVALMVTITSSTLFASGYGNKEVVYKVSIYSFVASMMMFLLSYGVTQSLW